MVCLQLKVFKLLKYCFYSTTLYQWVVWLVHNFDQNLNWFYWKNVAGIQFESIAYLESSNFKISSDLSFSGELDLFQTQKFIANNIYTDYQVIESFELINKIYLNVFYSSFNCWIKTIWIWRIYNCRIYWKHIFNGRVIIDRIFLDFGSRYKIFYFRWDPAKNRLRVLE